MIKSAIDVTDVPRSDAPRRRPQRQRLGRTWQDPHWRKARLDALDAATRAEAALARLSEDNRATPAPTSEAAPGMDVLETALSPLADPHSSARTHAPFTGDAIPAAGPFVIKPEVVRGGFA